ncbi:SPOR domain-containing protein [Vibrio halioticoli]|nr:SPOR domain-containing protein [Vibrio halioticoli]
MMKKTAIVSLALLLAACSSSEYETDIQSESYQENYQTTQAEVDAKKPQIEEQDLTPVVTPIAQDTSTSNVATDNATADNMTNNAKPMTDAQEGDSVESTASTAAPEVEIASLNAPSKGFSIQLATLSDKTKAQAFAEQLKADSTLWVQTKTINDKVVYSVVMGDYADYDHAKAAVAALPERLQKLQPFVKNFTDKELAATDHFLLLK